MTHTDWHKDVIDIIVILSVMLLSKGDSLYFDPYCRHRYIYIWTTI